MISLPPKDPTEVLDYALVWTKRGMAGDKIISTQADILAGTVQIEGHQAADVPPHAKGHVTVTWLSGGTHGETATLWVQITTEMGRVMEQTVQVPIVTR